MRTSTFRVLAATGTGLALAAAVGPAASAATQPGPLTTPIAQAACQAGGGTPVQANFGPLGNGRACLGGSQAGAAIAPPAGL